METFQKPTESELEVLKVLWQMGRATVKQVNEEINKTKDTGYTTTLKIMQIMFEKGLVSKNADGKQHIFEAKIGEEDTQKSLLNRFIDSTFQGNAMSLVMQALGNHHASEEELSELKKLIKQLEKDK
ncbi:BlaI/MecI/CopY family transcriptional regulator [Lacihabitans sp. CCS-44]|uniref:BlaI/MecI/CopY family transcriptional regulator n=1 Tax=Lacihabitans sp. CCS-44 TaxID=2487331 RepID=UPI0020CEBBCF|nr:BlaI/MecI/CopY family transcriptional regulator [Lacihabitans sp. CCS-44]MCP9755622.1 BlaI/MecI/CopY family transcriptional regulator [Lacihabitans sp. CCS-44]